MFEGQKHLVDDPGDLIKSIRELLNNKNKTAAAADGTSNTTENNAEEIDNKPRRAKKSTKE